MLTPSKPSPPAWVYRPETTRVLSFKGQKGPRRTCAGRPETLSRTPASTRAAGPVSIRTQSAPSRVSVLQRSSSAEAQGGYWPLLHSRSQPPAWCANCPLGQ